MKIGYDAKRIVRNGTGLGNYGRTLVNDIAQYDRQLDLRLYAPDKGRDKLRGQIVAQDNVSFCYPHDSALPFAKAWWRTKGMVKDLQRDQIQIYHGLSGELPFGISKTNIRSVVTIHDLIFLRHPEFYHWIDTKIYTWKFEDLYLEIPADHQGGRPYHRHQRMYEAGYHGVRRSGWQSDQRDLSELRAEI